jgi:hypothetical protein
MSRYCVRLKPFMESESSRNSSCRSNSAERMPSSCSAWLKRVVVAAVHGGDVDRDVPLLVDVLDRLVTLLRGDHPLEDLEVVQDETETGLVVGFGHCALQLFEPRQGLRAQLREVVVEIDPVEAVLAAEEPIELDRELEPLQV